MPSKLKAGGTFPYILEADRSDGVQPQFAIRVLSAFEDGELNAIRDEYIATHGQPAKRTDLIKQALVMTVAACHIENIKADALMSELTARECWELINAATEGATLKADERKKFVSPPPCETDSSADGAEASA